jgi:hypothetical protein
MNTSFSKLRYLGLFAFLAAGLVVLSLDAQPPGKKGPPVSAEILTIRGTVRDFTTAPKGEIDGVTLNDGTWVHWPPHLADRFSSIIAKGDRIKVVGSMETGPAGDTKLEVSSVTNLKNDRTALNPDRPLPASASDGATCPADNGALTVSGIGREFTTAPKGEVDGVILNNGKWVHWPPHLEDRFTSIIAKGDSLRAVGFTETGPKGDTKLEVSVLTNTRTGKSAQNPDRPLPAADRPNADSREERLQALEDQIQQILREIQRLRKEK